MQNAMNTDISYDRLDALIERGRQTRSDTIGTTLAVVSMNHLLARLGRRLPVPQGADAAMGAPTRP